MLSAKNIQTRLELSFNQYKTRCAIEYKNTKMSYEELDEKSTKLAHILILQGAQQEDFIGIYTKDKVSHIVSMIAILKIRGIMVPLDTSYPIQRTEAMIQTSNTKFILTDDLTQDIFLEDILNVRKIINVNEHLQHQNTYLDELNFLYSHNDKIYVFFTSGTTGTPKAIMGRNESLLHFINWEIEEFNIDHNCRVSQFTGVCHDPVLRDIFVPLFAGGTICIPNDKEIILESNSLMEWIEIFKITLIHCTPSLFRLINGKTLSDDNFSSLKTVLLAGERVSSKLLVHWYDIIGERIQLVNLYGPTETTLAKLFYRISVSDIQLTNIPIGKAIPGSKVAILDDNLQFSIPGVTGNIYIRTPYKTFGYINNEELQKQNFIMNPFNNDPEDVMYRTGDLGRILDNGDVEFIGRKDRQIKLHGVRIELNELENVLINYEKIKEAVVISKLNAQDILYLCAYIVFEQEDNLTSSSNNTSQKIRDFLSLKVPDYMIPQHIIFIDKLPINTNGKIDYNALPEPEQNKYVAPIDDVEKKLAEIWSEILGIQKVSREDGFIESGGHSLNVISLVYRIHEEYNIELPLAEVFKNITIKELANYIRIAS